jgi:hypothetical protein
MDGFISTKTSGYRAKYSRWTIGKTPLPVNVKQGKQIRFSFNIDRHKKHSNNNYIETGKHLDKIFLPV